MDPVTAPQTDSRRPALFLAASLISTYFSRRGWLNRTVIISLLIVNGLFLGAFLLGTWSVSMAITSLQEKLNGLP